MVGDSLEVSLPYIITLEDTSYALVPLTSQVAFSYVLRILLRSTQNEIIMTANVLLFFLLFGE